MLYFVIICICVKSIKKHRLTAEVIQQIMESVVEQMLKLSEEQFPNYEEMSNSHMTENTVPPLYQDVMLGQANQNYKLILYKRIITICIFYLATYLVYLLIIGFCVRYGVLLEKDTVKTIPLENITVSIQGTQTYIDEPLPPYKPNPNLAAQEN
ncbi:hypothetical protein O9G_000649 [Rozella allomycis CSF55]|uniref:Uncharacterized protein n=1 Tax=Rozella allomycis (strain CSF55) TaxID=988480 RepID=A0A075B377_ROZAC|nr:hypothetical protein O9G_000649 [Rozella allomycis CSF55]|eukprot:EPZ35253.1 hypothetical protein O9G_000649 [Rozella allomycis CSF55]